MIRNNLKYTFASKRGHNVKFDLETQIDCYLQAKRIEKRSPKTITSYAQSLKQFRQWFESRTDLELNSGTMREFIHYLTYEKLTWDNHPSSPTVRLD